MEICLLQKMFKFMEGWGFIDFNLIECFFFKNIVLKYVFSGAASGLPKKSSRKSRRKVGFKAVDSVRNAGTGKFVDFLKQKN